MPVLKNWLFVRYGFEEPLFQAKGIVYDHPKQDKCPHGLFVHTSGIQDIQVQEEAFIVTTNNTKYILFKSDMLQDFPECIQKKYIQAAINNCLMTFLDHDTFTQIMQELPQIADKDIDEYSNIILLT